MDASQYKDYVLFMLFIKYISDEYGNSEDFAPSVIIPKGASFTDMIALKGKPDIGDRINTQIIQPLLVARCFADAQAAIEAAQAELETAAASLAELEEEHGGEEGFLGALDKIAKAEINARLREMRHDKEATDEIAVLNRWLELADSEAVLKRAVKEQEAALDTLAYRKYAELGEAGIKTLVVGDKWMMRLAADVQGELDRVSQTLTGRVRLLAERYSTPLPTLEEEAATLAERVMQHLKHMGMQAWVAPGRARSK